MANLNSKFIGIKSPNPFWLASAPPTDKEYNVRRAFESGWGGVVWKTLGEAGPPIVNVNGPRYGAIWGADRRLLGLNNIELITDRPDFTESQAAQSSWGSGSDFPPNPPPRNGLMTRMWLSGMPSTWARVRWT